MVSPKTSALRKFIFSTNLESSISRLETNKSDSDWIYLSPFPSLTASFCQNERVTRSEEHTSELQSRGHLVCRLLLEKKKKTQMPQKSNTTTMNRQAGKRPCPKIRAKTRHRYKHKSK